MKLTVLIILSSVLIIGCNLSNPWYKIPKNEYGEPILYGKVKYSFTELPTHKDLEKIDTTAYYVQIFEGRYYNDGERRNPKILIFHNDGYFKRESLLYFGKFDAERGKNSVYYGGKWRITGDSIIELEQFLPTSSGSNWYTRNIERGIITGNKIILKKYGYVYEKRSTFK